MQRLLTLLPPVLLLLLLLLVAELGSCQFFKRPVVESPEYWARSARDELNLAQQVYQRKLLERAKSVVLMIGDGMGISSITPARILKGQLANQSGEEAKLVFDTFPHVALSKTYSANRQTADSPETASAMVTGVKINNGMLSVKETVPRSHCTMYDAAVDDLQSFLRMAVNMGMSAGVVSTTRITHATPASTYANSVDRNWESDSDRATDTRGNNTVAEKMNCTDVATQLVEKAWNFSVILGGGRVKFLPNTTQTWNPSSGSLSSGVRWDGVNLVDRWQQRQRDAGRRPLYVENRTQLLNFDANSVDSLFGLFATSHLSYDYDNQQAPADRQNPTLQEMTEAALKILRKNPKGYVLMVEGGRIDQAHHSNKAQLALYETLAFDKAIDSVVRTTSEDDTLLIVTADHGHVFSLGQYGMRGQPITGLRYTDKGEPELAPDGLPFTVLNYADGPSAPRGAMRKNLTGIDLENSTATSGYMYPAMIPYDYDSHGGEDVPIYARGPSAHLFHSVHEQSYIAHVIMRSLCMGAYREDAHCKPDTGGGGPKAGGRLLALPAVWPLLLLAACAAALRWL